MDAVGCLVYGLNSRLTRQMTFKYV